MYQRNFTEIKRDVILCVKIPWFNETIFNSFHVTSLFLYLMKTSENLSLSDVFRGYRKRQVQKQPSRVVIRKRCFENMQKIYTRTPMSKYDFSKVAWNHTSAWVFSCKFSAYFQNTFSLEHLWMADSASSLKWIRYKKKLSNKNHGQ